MKGKSKFILRSCTILAYLVSCNGKQRIVNKSIEFESIFIINYNILDSISKRNIFDTSQICKGAIKFMEKASSIKPSTNGNYFGKILFTRKDLIKWKDWYDKNKK